VGPKERTTLEEEEQQLEMMIDCGRTAVRYMMPCFNLRGKLIHPLPPTAAGHPVNLGDGRPSAGAPQLLHLRKMTADHGHPTRTFPLPPPIASHVW
jgi:hypothetical protein